MEAGGETGIPLSLSRGVTYRKAVFLIFSPVISSDLKINCVFLPWSFVVLCSSRFQHFLCPILKIYNCIICIRRYFMFINPLTPNDHYSGRTASLTSKRCILYIYSTNISNEYFKHGIYSPFFLFKMQFF